MLPDNTIVQTSHGQATVKFIREQDIPHWQSAADHAKAVLHKLRTLIGAEPPVYRCPHCKKPI